jgi:hypothetical protein
MMLIRDQAAVREGETSEKIVDSLEWIARIVFRADEYTKLFAHQEISAQPILRRLHDDLVALSTEVLIFLFRAREFFEKRSISMYTSAFLSFQTEVS